MTAFVKFIEEIEDVNTAYPPYTVKTYYRTQFIAVDSIESIGFELVDKPKTRVVTKSGKIMIGNFILKNEGHPEFDGYAQLQQFCSDFKQLVEEL